MHVGCRIVTVHMHLRIGYSYIVKAFMQILENVPLAPLTTFKVGGPARYFCEPKTPQEVSEAVAFAQTRKFPLFVLGGGSNLVVSDKGWPGLVIKIGITGIEDRTEDGKKIFEVGAGEEWD